MSRDFLTQAYEQAKEQTVTDLLADADLDHAEALQVAQAAALTMLYGTSYSKQTLQMMTVAVLHGIIVGSLASMIRLETPDD